MLNKDRRVIGLTCIGHALCHIYLLVYATALIEISGSLKVSLTKITAIGTVSYFLFGIGALAAGFFTMKTNAKFMLKLFFLLSGISSMVTGLFKSLPLFAVGLSLLGLFCSIYHVAGLTLLSHNIAKKGKALGYHGIAGSAGVTLAPLIAGLLITAFGWRMMYIILGIPGILVFIFLSFDKTRYDTHLEAQERASTPDRGISPVFFIIVLIIIGLNGFIYRGFLTVFPMYISQNVTLEGLPSVLKAGTLATVILAFGMIGQYIGGHTSDKISMPVLYLILALLGLPFILIMGFSKNILLILVSVAFSIAHFALQPVENHIISHYSPPKFVSSAFGVKFVMTFGVGSFAALCVGLFTDRFSMNMVFYLLTGCICLIVILTIILSLMERSHR